MEKPNLRSDRSCLETRPYSFEVNINKYAEGSVLVKCGNTHVLITISFEKDLPKWLQGKGQGWVTAEYSMLPRATHTRNKRDREKISGRTQEIQRLIARALRSMVDLKKLGEHSIIVDCDVLQADGGTRTTSITGACVALTIAIKKMGLENALLGTVSAVSVGLKNGQVLVDLNYDEDSSCDVDMNFVVTGEGHFVEIQGTAEKGAFSLTEMNGMTIAAQEALKRISALQSEVIQKVST